MGTDFDELRGQFKQHGQEWIAQNDDPSRIL